MQGKKGNNRRSKEEILKGMKKHNENILKEKKTSGTKDMLRKTKEEMIRKMMKTHPKNTGGEKKTSGTKDRPPKYIGRKKT